MNRQLPIPSHLGGILVGSLLSVLLVPAHAAATHHGRGLSIAPAGLVAAIAKTQARAAAKDPAYRIAKNGCASLQTGPKGASLKGCFADRGERFASGEDTVGLHLAAWGRVHHLQPIVLKRTAPEANRIEYRGQGVSEWWRVLPMGYEQGFTLEHAPKGHGEVVLQLQASRAPTLAHGTLSWGGLHYGKLRVVDAAGKTLPSHLSAKGRTITLEFEASHAHYPVRIDPLVWLQPQTLTDPAGTGGDDFGWSVALDSTGTTALVGAPFTNSNAGAAYIYTQSSGAWSKVATLTDPAGTSNDEFGYSVALDSTGTTALVGAFGTNSGAGAAYIYTQSSGTWSKVATLTVSGSTDLGLSVALDSTGTTALVGAAGTNSGAGAAYLYTQSSGTWPSTPTATLTASGSGELGSSVALDSTGTTALVGANYTNGSAGAAYIYTQNSGAWPSTPTATLTDPAGTGNDFFGYSVALDSTGTTALVGAYGTSANAGAAYIYTQSSGTWPSTPTATLTDPAGTGGDDFGSSVALDSSGATALVGAFYTNSEAGAAYTYTQNSGAWAATPTATLTASGSDFFGYSVALDSTGTTALVGAYGTNSGAGAAYVVPGTQLSAVLNVPASVAPSTQYDAEYIVTNNGTAASGDVQAQMPVPAGASLVYFGASQGSCTYDGTTQAATCDLGSIPGSGSMATAVLNLQSGATAGTIVQTASLVGASLNLAQSGSTSVGTASGGGGAIGLWALLGLLGLAGAMRVTRRGARRRG